MNYILKIISYIGLGLTLIPSFLVFTGNTTLDFSKNLMLIGTILWFLFAPIWMNKTEK
jgi:hypothetical protein